MINCAPRFNLYPFAIAALPSSPPVIFMAYKHVGWLCWTSHLKSTITSSSSPVLPGQGTERETIYLSGEYIEMLTEERQSCPLCAAAVVVPVTGEPHPTAQHHDKINCRLVRRGRTCLFLFFSLVQWPPTSRVVDEIHVISTLVGPFCLTHPPGPDQGQPCDALEPVNGTS